MQSRELTYESADGLALFCREYVAARPELDILCLPGLTRNSRDFAPLAQTLAGRYRVLTPDLRGRGRSAWDPQWANYHPGVYVTDLLRLLEHLDIRRVAIIGTSLGGLLAMMLAASRPDLVAAVVLNDVAPEIAPEGLVRIAQYAGRAQPATNWDQAVQQAQANYGHALPGLSLAQWRDFTESSYRQTPEGSVVADYDPNIGTALRAAPPVPVDLWALYRTLAAKSTLAIRGALSDIVNPATFDRMLAEKPDLQRVTVANRGHAPLLDEPESVHAIASFLASLKTSAE